MTGISGAATILAVCAVWIVVLQGAAFAVGHRIRRYNVVDVIWGLGFVGIGVIALVLGGGDLTRRIVLAVVVAVWGLRLSWHMHVKTRGHGEDPRYVDYLGQKPTVSTVIGKVFATQGASQIWVGLPIVVSAVCGATTGPGWILLVIGAAAALVGFSFEAIGDAQLRAYKADPDRGPIMDRGLWGWTRHPNYFGDACLWWGLWLIAASGGLPAVLTVLSPVAMTYFIVHATGARRLEAAMADRPGYADYRARTSYLLPRPPRRSP